MICHVTNKKEEKITEVTEVIVPEVVTEKSIDKKRPSNFKDYIGQTNAKKILKSYIHGIRKRKIQFPHLLIYGPAGCGKTTLAKIMANELQYNFIELIASEVESIETLVDLILDSPKSLIFFDEIHGLKREFVEPLYPLMEDFKYENTKIPEFTLIGATTELGEIIKTRKPFYDRFILKQELQDYTPEHIFKIIKKYNYRLYQDFMLPDVVLKLLSRNSRNTPRIGISLLQSTIYLSGKVEDTIKSNNIIYNGFTTTDLKTLKIIAEHTRGIGVQAIAAFLNTSADNYTYMIEPWLLKTRCIIRTNRGRIISKYGLRLIHKLENSGRIK